MEAIFVQVKWLEPSETGGREILEYRLQLAPPPQGWEEGIDAEVGHCACKHGTGTSAMQLGHSRCSRLNPVQEGLEACTVLRVDWRGGGGAGLCGGVQGA